MEDHLMKIPMMPSASPAESSGSGGTEDSRGGTKARSQQQKLNITKYFLFSLYCKYFRTLEIRQN